MWLTHSSLKLAHTQHVSQRTVHLVHHGVRLVPFLFFQVWHSNTRCRANRGIGLELTKQLLQSPGNVVVAACRDPTKADSLQSLKSSAGGRLHVVRLDVNDKQTIQDAAQETAKVVGEKGIDYLINNAGIVRQCRHSSVRWLPYLTIGIDQIPGGADTAFTMNLDDLITVFKTNLAGPASVSQTFVTLVEKSKKKTIINISSTLGSIETSPLGPGAASYSIAKAGLNMLVRWHLHALPTLVQRVLMTD